MEKCKTKEKTYYGVRESAIDKDILEKIKKFSQRINIVMVIFLICSCLFLMLQFFSKYFSETFVLTCSIIQAVVAVAMSVVCIVTTVKLLKLKKQILQAQQTSKEDADRS